jgi:hypothetical protein
MTVAGPTKQERDRFLYRFTLELGLPLSLLHVVAFYVVGIEDLWMYLLFIAWCFAGSYAFAWVHWVALERPRIERMNRSL